MAHLLFLTSNLLLPSTVYNCLSVPSSGCVSAWLPLCLFVQSSVCLAVCVPVYHCVYLLSPCLCVCLSTIVFVCSVICVFACVPLCLSVQSSVCLYVTIDIDVYSAFAVIFNILCLEVAYDSVRLFTGICIISMILYLCIMYYTMCYLTGIFYAVVKQISMLFIDNKISVFYLPVYHCVYLFSHQSVCLSTIVFICSVISLSACLPLCLSVQSSVCLSQHLFSSMRC